MKYFAFLVCSSLSQVLIVFAATKAREIPTATLARVGTIDRFPYQISLRRYTCHFCGGSIISEWFVISNAHCVTEVNNGVLTIRPVASFSIRAGSENIFAKEVERQVVEIKIHEKFKSLIRNNTSNGTSSFDVTLLRVSEAFKFGYGVVPIKIASTELREGTKVVISGWGRINEMNQLAETLQYAELYSSSSSSEPSYHQGGEPGKLLLFLRSHGNKGGCVYDSGGPAVANSKLVGIATFAQYGCGQPNSDVYLNVSYFYDWIKHNAELEYY